MRSAAKSHGNPAPTAQPSGAGVTLYFDRLNGNSGSYDSHKILVN
jgi:hypothetical protein